jgi:hypothetical protein
MNADCKLIMQPRTSVMYSLILSNPIILPTAYSPALIYFGWERGYERNRANTTHYQLFTSKHMACRETERVQPALRWLKSVLHEEKRRTGSDNGAGGPQTQQKRVGHLPTSERNRKIIMSDEVRRRIGKG